MYTAPTRKGAKGDGRVRPTGFEWAQIFKRNTQLYQDTALYVKMTEFLVFDVDKIPDRVKNIPAKNILNSTSMVISEILSYTFGKCQEHQILLERSKSKSAKKEPPPKADKNA